MKLYNELSSWWQLMSPAAEYVEEAEFYRNTLNNAAPHPIQTLLELGSGGGNNACHMKRHYQEMVLVDLSAGMLAMSRSLNPELEHYQGDMRSVRLNRQFDAVFVHDAVCYMTTESDLRKAIETAFVHCKPGGVALFCPDYIRENFEPGADHGGEDDGPRGMRWLSWQWQRDTSDTTCTSWTTRICCVKAMVQYASCTIAISKACLHVRRGCDCFATSASSTACCRSSTLTSNPGSTRCSSASGR